jgi:hypothetical protein
MQLNIESFYSPNAATTQENYLVFEKQSHARLAICDSKDAADLIKISVEEFHKKRLKIPSIEGYDNEKFENIIFSIINELASAKKKHPKNLNSWHEAYGVIKEEFDEMWEEMKKNPKKFPQGEVENKVREEAIQTAAMLLKFLVELL